MLFVFFIGIGRGINNLLNLSYIIEDVSVFVIVDVGIGFFKDVCYVMEFGVDGILFNIVILVVKDFVKMVEVMKLGINVGRFLYEVGCIFVKYIV